MSDSVWAPYEASGAYEIQVIGEDSGEYHLSVRATDAEGQPVIDTEASGTIESGETITTNGRLTTLGNSSEPPGSADDSGTLGSVSPEAVAGGGVVGIGLLYLASRLLSDSS